MGLEGYRHGTAEPVGLEFGPAGSGLADETGIRPVAGWSMETRTVPAGPGGKHIGVERDSVAESCIGFEVDFATDHSHFVMTHHTAAGSVDGSSWAAEAEIDCCPVVDCTEIEMDRSH